MEERKEREWTLMFYFASDNPLAPNIVTQLKAITNAGFHQDVNVVAKFDPQSGGIDTHVFDVNLVNKLLQKKLRPDNQFKFWGDNDPFIRNLVFDKLWSDGDDHPEEKLIRQHVAKAVAESFDELEYNPPDPLEFIDKRLQMERAEAARRAEKNPDAVGHEDPKEPSPKESLEDFLEFCAKSYPAKNYMLFLVGHGLIVGNDMFLFDENAKESSLSLKNLAAVLEKFTSFPTGKKIELLGFHSCSMSSIEVAYELRDSVNFMLASQGPEFVGTWPYREILIRIFNDQIDKANSEKGKKGKKEDKESSESRHEEDQAVRKTIEKIFEYILRNSFDFQLAGYSFDLCMTNLEAVDQITCRLHDLAKLMTANLNDDVPFVKEAILLAHWDAQSFWQDTYTDLYDFCWCLKRRCETMSKDSERVTRFLGPIINRCTPIINALASEVSRGRASEVHHRKGNGSVIRAAFAGPQYQYSRGLSVYFPWSEPTNQFFWNTEYKERYVFAQTGWAEFLQTYFDKTQRKTVHEEIVEEFGANAETFPSERELVLDIITRRVFNLRGPMSRISGPDRRGLKEVGGVATLEGPKAGGGSTLEGPKAGGGSTLEGPKAGGGSTLEGPKAGGGSTMGFNKAGGGSTMAVDKPGGDSSHGGDGQYVGTKNYPSFTRTVAMPELEPDGNLKETEVKTASPDFYHILLDF